MPIGEEDVSCCYYTLRFTVTNINSNTMFLVARLLCSTQNQFRSVHHTEFVTIKISPVNGGKMTAVLSFVTFIVRNPAGSWISSPFLMREMKCLYLNTNQIKLNSVALVRERTIPTERPPPVGEVSANFCG